MYSYFFGITFLRRDIQSLQKRVDYVYTFSSRILCTGKFLASLLNRCEAKMIKKYCILHYWTSWSAAWSYAASSKCCIASKCDNFSLVVLQTRCHGILSTDIGNTPMGRLLKVHGKFHCSFCMGPFSLYISAESKKESVGFA